MSRASGATPTATMRAIAKRSIGMIPRMPATFIPSVAFPVLITVAISGALGGVAMLPGYPVPSQIDWVMPFACVQAGALAGMGVGFSLIRDLETRFFDRFLLAPVSRVSLILGFLSAAFVRALVPLTVVVAIGTLDGARIQGGLAGLGTLVLANQGAALLGGCWGVGMALRFKTMRIAPLMFLPVFLAVFLSTAQVPLQYITGWLEPVATVNPVTQILDLARAGFVGDVTWGSVWPALVVFAVAIPLLGWFALRGLRRIET